VKWHIAKICVSNVRPSTVHSASSSKFKKICEVQHRIKTDAVGGKNERTVGWYKKRLS
jgi:hypothetical protein